MGEFLPLDLSDCHALPDQQLQNLNPFPKPDFVRNSVPFQLAIILRKVILVLNSVLLRYFVS